MIREIVHDPLFLSRKSTPAGKEDLPICQDLRDTLAAHRESCVGMAANMIGQTKNIIIFDWDGRDMVMLNPVILRTWEPYDTEEGCLSLLGGPRKTVRFRKIKVSYETESLQNRIHSFEGWTAQIIQHEIDHLHGVLI